MQSYRLLDIRESSTKAGKSQSPVLKKRMVADGTQTWSCCRIAKLLGGGLCVINAMKITGHC